MAVHEDYQEMLAAHGLGALDVEEARTLELHLRDCADCSQELDEWKATAAMLALDAAPVAPSERLRNRIIDAVRNDVASPKSPGSTVEPAAAARREGTNVVSLPTHRKTLSGIPSWFAIAAGSSICGSPGILVCSLATKQSSETGVSAPRRSSSGNSTTSGPTARGARARKRPRNSRAATGWHEGTAGRPWNSRLRQERSRNPDGQRSAGATCGQGLSTLVYCGWETHARQGLHHGCFRHRHAHRQYAFRGNERADLRDYA